MARLFDGFVTVWRRGRVSDDQWSEPFKECERRADHAHVIFRVLAIGLVVGDRDVQTSCMPLVACFIPVMRSHLMFLQKSLRAQILALLSGSLIAMLLIALACFHFLSSGVQSYHNLIDGPLHTSQLIDEA